MPVVNTYYNQFGIRSVLPWQIDLMSMNDDEVLRGRNLVYCAPTGIGKSLVYELLMLRRIQHWKGQCLIVLPFISLIEEKKSYLSSLCERNGIYVDCYFGGGSQRLDPRIDVRMIWRGMTRQIAISTVEKANLVINRCIMEGTVAHFVISNPQTPAINMLIVDEAQTLEGERGYLLELLVLKLRSFNPRMQIVFLSATLPNPHAIGRWLDAAVYLYDEHRSQCDEKRETLEEYVVMGGDVCLLGGEVMGGDGFSRSDVVVSGDGFSRGDEAVSGDVPSPTTTTMCDNVSSHNHTTMSDDAPSSNHPVVRFGSVDHNTSLVKLVQWLFAKKAVHTILVFAPTKNRCEKIVRLLLPFMVLDPLHHDS